MIQPLYNLGVFWTEGKEDSLLKNIGEKCAYTGNESTKWELFHILLDIDTNSFEIHTFDLEDKKIDSLKVPFAKASKISARTRFFKISPAIKIKKEYLDDKENLNKEILSFIKASKRFFEDVDNEQVKKAFSVVSKNEKAILKNTVEYVVENSTGKNDIFVFFKIKDKKSGKIGYYLGDFKGVIETMGKRFLKYVMEQDAKEETCVCCGKVSKCSGRALKDAGLKFSTDDRTIFFPDANSKGNLVDVAPLCENCFPRVLLGGLVLLDMSANIRSVKGINFLIVPWIEERGNKERAKRLREILKRFMKGDSDIVDGLIYMNKTQKILTKETHSVFSNFEIMMYVVNKSQVQILNHETGFLPEKILNVQEAWRKVRGEFEKLYSPFFLIERLIEAHENTHIKEPKERLYKDAGKIYFRILKNMPGWDVWALRKFNNSISSSLHNKGFKKLYFETHKFIKFLEILYEMEGVKMKINIEDVLNSPEGELAFNAGKLSALVMDTQRREKNIKEGDEPFRKSIANFASQGSRGMMQIFTRAVEKLNQYGKGTSGIISDSEIEKMLILKHNSKTPPYVLSFLFSLGLMRTNWKVKK